MLPSLRGATEGTLPLETCKLDVLVRLLDAVVNDVEIGRVVPSGGEDDNESDARESAAAVCMRAGLD